MKLRPLLAVIAALGCAGMPGARAADEIRPSVGLDYAISVSGLPALSASATIGADGTRYDVRITARTSGLIGAIFPWTISIGSNGNVAGDRLQPVMHRQTSRFQGKDRSVFLDYDGRGGFLERRTVPDAHEDLRDEVPVDMTRDTLDIISSVLAGLRTVDRTGSCAGSVPVFDGRRRFDLVYSDDGHQKLGSRGAFSGDALRCQVEVKPLAGFWRKSQKRWFSAGGDRVVPITVYIARVGKAGVEVPVRLESSSPFGPLVVGLEGIRDSPPSPGG